MHDELTQVSKAEQNNLARSLDRLGDTSALVQDFSDAHAKLVDLLGETTPPNAEVLTFTSLMLMAVRYQLVIGALALLRGHLTDAMQTLRRAIELAAFAYRIHAVPALKDVWMRAENDKASFKHFRREFKSEKLFPKTHPLLHELYKRYDLCSRALHSSLTSLAHRGGVDVKDGKAVVSFEYFELSEEDASEPARGFLYMLDAHFGILRLFTEIYAAQLGPVRGQWDTVMGALAAKLEMRKQHWKPIILAKRSGGT